MSLLEKAENWISADKSTIPCPLCEEVNASNIGLIPVKSFDLTLFE